MSKWKKINQSDISFTENILHKTQNLDSSSSDIRVLPYLSGSVSSSAYAAPPTDSGSLYTFLQTTIYLSGSNYVNSLTDTYEKKKLSELHHSLRYTDEVKPQHINKFFDSGSLLSIPRKYYEDEIKATTFELIDNSHSSGTVMIRDDGWGNLYSVSNTVSQSTNSPSSSDNYVGNIFYEQGLVILTDTGSYSHTPSTASFEVSTAVSHSSYIKITGSDFNTSIEFRVSSGSVPADTTRTKYLLSGSTTTATAQNFVDKINSVFIEYITASLGGNSNVVTMSNDRKPNNPLNTTNNLPSITGSLGLTSFTGFGGGVANISYLDALTGQFTFKFKSTRRLYTKEIIATVEPSEFNFTNNSTIRGFPTESGIVKISESPWFLPQFTSSIFQPYVTSIDLYDSKTTGPVARAKLAQPVQIRNDMPISFKLKLDL